VISPRRRIIIAILVSIAFNLCWISAQVLTGNPEREEQSLIYKITEICATPGALVSVALGQPQERDMPSIVFSIITTIVISIVFYAAIAWLVMLIADRFLTEHF
jgi:hypothetical protein